MHIQVKYNTVQLVRYNRKKEGTAQKYIPASPVDSRTFDLIHQSNLQSKSTLSAANIFRLLQL